MRPVPGMSVGLVSVRAAVSAAEASSPAVRSAGSGSSRAARSASAGSSCAARSASAGSSCAAASASVGSSCAAASASEASSPAARSAGAWRPAGTREAAAAGAGRNRGHRGSGWLRCVVWLRGRLCAPARGRRGRRGPRRRGRCRREGAAPVRRGARRRRPAATRSGPEGTAAAFAAARGRRLPRPPSRRRPTRPGGGDASRGTPGGLSPCVARLLPGAALPSPRDVLRQRPSRRHQPRRARGWRPRGRARAVRAAVRPSPARPRAGDGVRGHG